MLLPMDHPRVFPLGTGHLLLRMCICRNVQVLSQRVTRGRHSDSGSGAELCRDRSSHGPRAALSG